MSVYTMTRMICGKCGIEFDMPEPFREERLKTGEAWYCPNGHPRVYAETEADKLKKQLAQAQERERMARLDVITERNRADREHKRAARAETKLKRVGCGVCPECNRSFTNLRRHMASKHDGPGRDPLPKKKKA